MPKALEAFLWGGLAGSAVLIGAIVGLYVRVPTRWIAAVMAFGAGVLISALAFELMDEAFKRGGFGLTAAGFLGGAVVYTGVDWYLAHRGAKHRKSSGGGRTGDNRQPSESENPG